MPGFSLVFPWFGICGMFTESASVKSATPVYVHYHQLGPSSRGRPEYRPSTNLQHPWKGGWWRLRDILDGQKVASYATLEVAAINRRMILQNMYRKATRARKRGSEEAPYAYVFPTDQHDPLTALKLLRIMRNMGVEIHIAEAPFKVGSATYSAGSHVVFMGQTARAFLVSYLGRTLYRDSVHVRNRDGTPMMNYDFATMTMAEFKGVEVVEAAQPVEGEFRELDVVDWPQGQVVGRDKSGWVLDPRLNDGYKAVNMLLASKVAIHRVEEPVETPEGALPAGAW